MSSSNNYKGPEWLVQDYPPLKYDNVGKAAVEGQTFEYPKISRGRSDPPIEGQKIGNISFMLFKEPKTLSTGKKVYGFFNLRGNFSDEDACKKQATKIIREHDSRHQIRFAPVGNWLPITDEEAFCKDIEDVRMSEEEVHMRDAVKKEKIAESKRIQREINERMEDLQNDGDIYDNPESARYYAMRRVTEMKLVEARGIKEKELNGIKKNILKVRKELKNLEEKYQDYSDKWIDLYNEERAKGGIPAFIPGEDQFEEFENSKLEEIETALEKLEVEE